MGGSILMCGPYACGEIGVDSDVGGAAGADAGSGDASGGDMVIIEPPPAWLPGECSPDGAATGGGTGPISGTGGGPPLVLEKLDRITLSIMSGLIGRPQSSRSRPSRMRRSIERALVGYAITRKKEMVRTKSSFRTSSWTNPRSVGSRKTAESVTRLPHCLWILRLDFYQASSKQRGGVHTHETFRRRW